MSQGNEYTEISTTKIEEPTVAAAGSAEDLSTSIENAETNHPGNGDYTMTHVLTTHTDVSTETATNSGLDASQQSTLTEPVALVVSNYAATSNSPSPTPTSTLTSANEVSTEGTKRSRRPKGEIPMAERVKRAVASAKAEGIVLSPSIADEYLLKGVEFSKYVVKDLGIRTKRYGATVQEVLNDHLPEAPYANLLSKRNRLRIALDTNRNELLAYSELLALREPALLECLLAEVAEQVPGTVDSNPETQCGEITTQEEAA